MFNFFRKKKISHPVAPNLANYMPGMILTPGTESLIYETPFNLPAFATLGAGRGIRKQLAVLQNQQQPVVHRVPTRGIGGTVAGQMVSQPLAHNAPQKMS